MTMLRPLPATSAFFGHDSATTLFIANEHAYDILQRRAAMARLNRRKVPDKIGLAVALRQLGFKQPELDHDPALGLRERTPDGGYIPDEHDPDHLVWREKDEHAVKTRGSGATTAGSDIGNMRHLRDLTASEEEFRRRMLAKEPGKPPASKGTIRSRGFSKLKRPMNAWRGT